MQGFPLMLNWYIVQRRNKRLPPVAQAFKDFLLCEGAGLIDQMMAAEPVKEGSAPARIGVKAL